jgi:2-C-methyl-D-erythritol 4-phosphate cytidylyltransferase
MSTAALIVAAGSGNRFGGEIPKQLVEVAGRPLLSWTLAAFEAADAIHSIVVVGPEAFLAQVTSEVIDPYDLPKVTKLVPGGQRRQESVFLGLQALPDSTELVAIHDGARAAIHPSDIENVVAAAKAAGAAMLIQPATDTVKRVADEAVVGTIDRRSIGLAQTPQVFRFSDILQAHRDAADHGVVTDDAALMEGDRDITIRAVAPRFPNPKVTTKADLTIVEAILWERLDD